MLQPFTKVKAWNLVKEEKVKHSRRGGTNRMCNRHLGKTAEKFALVSRLEATVSEYGKNLQDCKMEVLVGVRQQHSQLEFELSGQLHLFLNHMYALASIYGR